MTHLSLLLTLLLTASASAQVAPPDGRGAFVALGHGAPERLLFPADADPGVVVGLRLSPRADVQAGYTRRTRTAPDLFTSSWRTAETWERTGAVAVAGGFTDRAGPTRVRARLSLGYDVYTYRLTETEGAGTPNETTRLDRAERSESARLGASAEVGVPFGWGPVRTAPAAGVAAAVSGQTTGTLSAHPARVMPYVRVPVTAHVGGIALTLASTAGVAFGALDNPSVSLYDRLPSRSAASATGTPIVEVSVRADL